MERGVGRIGGDGTHRVARAGGVGGDAETVAAGLRRRDAERGERALSRLRVVPPVWRHWTLSICAPEQASSASSWLRPAAAAVGRASRATEPLWHCGPLKPAGRWGWVSGEGVGVAELPPPPPPQAAGSNGQEQGRAVGDQAASVRVHALCLPRASAATLMVSSGVVRAGLHRMPACPALRPDRRAAGLARRHGDAVLRGPAARRPRPPDAALGRRRRSSLRAPRRAAPRGLEAIRAGFEQVFGNGAIPVHPVCGAWSRVTAPSTMCWKARAGGRPGGAPPPWPGSSRPTCSSRRRSVGGSCCTTPAPAAQAM